MNFGIIYLLFSLKIFILLVYGVSPDCKKLNKLYNNPEDTDCCPYTNEFGCENDNYEIQELKIEITNENDINIENIPIFNKLKVLNLNIHTPILPMNINLNCSIEKIYLRDNFITTFPSQLLKLPNLKELDLSNNNLNSIPYGLINSLPNLKNLHLESNKITELPSQIFNLKNLKYIGLEGNNIHEIPETINTLNNIEEISLQNNKIEKFPFMFKYLPNLKN
eukprot:jgi/Orpsp1_1/1188111/evm.model.d7180000062511.1